MIRACSASDESGSPRSACTVSVYPYFKKESVGVGHTYLAADVVEQRAEYFCLRG
jgi:hypothetical protein